MILMTIAGLVMRQVHIGGLEVLGLKLEPRQVTIPLLLLVQLLILLLLLKAIGDQLRLRLLLIVVPMMEPSMAIRSLLMSISNLVLLSILP